MCPSPGQGKEPNNGQRLTGVEHAVWNAVCPAVVVCVARVKGQRTIPDPKDRPSSALGGHCIYKRSLAYFGFALQHSFRIWIYHGVCTLVGVSNKRYKRQAARSQRPSLWSILRQVERSCGWNRSRSFHRLRDPRWKLRLYREVISRAYLCSLPSQ